MDYRPKSNYANTQKAVTGKSMEIKPKSAKTSARLAKTNIEASFNGEALAKTTARADSAKKVLRQPGKLAATASSASMTDEAVVGNESDRVNLTLTGHSTGLRHKSGGGKRKVNTARREEPEQVQDDNELGLVQPKSQRTESRTGSRPASARKFVHRFVYLHIISCV